MKLLDSLMQNSAVSRVQPKIRPDVKHWHGATPDSWFAYIAISTNAQKGDAEWLEPVSDEE